MSAEERRESVVLASVSEFAKGGYHGTSTQAIADRVGVSQPYLFRLFPNKKALFLAAVTRCIEGTVAVFETAGDGLEGTVALDSMAAAYLGLITDRESLLMQLQVYVSTASDDLEEADREQIRLLWGRLWDTVAFDDRAPRNHLGVAPGLLKGQHRGDARVDRREDPSPLIAGTGHERRCQLCCDVWPLSAVELIGRIDVYPKGLDHPGEEH